MKQRVIGKSIRKSFTALTPAEFEACAASMTAELPGQFRWEKRHKERYGFDPLARLASMSDNSRDETDEERDAMIEQVFAECEWEDRQRLLAEGVSVPDESTAEDVTGALMKFRPPTFGSERWYRRLLIDTLLLIRRGCKSDLVAATQAECGSVPDTDSDVYLRIPIRHRRFYRLTNEWSKTMPWIGDLLDPKDEEPAVFIMAGLKSIGIDAYVILPLRDLHEERRIG